MTQRVAFNGRGSVSAGVPGLLLEVSFITRRNHGSNNISAVVKKTQINYDTLILLAVIKVKAHRRTPQQLFSYPKSIDDYSRFSREKSLGLRDLGHNYRGAPPAASMSVGWFGSRDNQGKYPLYLALAVLLD